MTKIITRSKRNALLKKIYKKKNCIGENILFLLCKEKNYIQLLKKYHKMGLDIFFVKDKFGNIPIFNITHHDNYEILIYILKKCKNIKEILNYENKYGCNLKSYAELRNPKSICMDIINRYY